MIRRWGIYLGALAAFLGFYRVYTCWAAWIGVLTVAGSPLISVAVSAVLGVKDPLGLFHLPQQAQLIYDWQLRAYRPGDSLSKVHWKRAGKTGSLLVRQEQVWKQPRRQKNVGILPVALCFLLLFSLFPPWRYGQQMDALQSLFRQKTQTRLDLTDGPRHENKQPLFDVVASQSQLLYLRGQVYEVYEGSTWRTETEETWSLWEPVGAVTAVARRGQLRPEPFLAVEEKGEKECLQLPRETKAWAAALTHGQTAQQIQTFVRSCASYDENAAASGEDVARWLIESGEGYCVHFATTAAVLLRGAGIPSRLVTGYAVQVQAGLRKTVTGQDAHAWVEYWDGQRWRILEATPTVEAEALPLVQKENRHFGGWWILLIAVAPLLFRRKKNRRLQELRQKAAFSQYGLTEEEKREKADILASLRKPKRERKWPAMKQDEKKSIPWEVADPKPPVVKSGKMESRKQN